MTNEVRERLAKARRKLQAAQALLSGGFPEDVVNRTYYVMFYAASAMHISEGRVYKKHNNLIAEFGMHFVKSGRISEKFHTQLRKAYELRDSADYKLFEENSVSVDEATAALREAESFLKMAEEFLKGAGG